MASTGARVAALLAALLVAAVMALTMAVGPASAAPGNNGKGAAKANPNAAFGISMAVERSGGGDCGLCNPF